MKTRKIKNKKDKNVHVKDIAKLIMAPNIAALIETNSTSPEDRIYMLLKDGKIITLVL